MRVRPLLVCGLCWVALVVATLTLRPPLPVDETRCLAVAWRMHWTGDWLVPRLGEHPYSDKPPLLLWWINLGWAAFGVSETWARLAPMLFAPLAVLFTARLARRLWPGRAAVVDSAPVLLCGAVLFALCSTVLMYDMLLTTCVLAALVALEAGRRRSGPKPWLGLGAALGLGLLGKGPVVLLHVAPAALAAPLWARSPRPARWGRFYGGFALALLVAFTIAGAWALPALQAGGPEFSRAILWGQISKRIEAADPHQHLHVRPWWFYAPLLLLAFLPWIVWPRLWRGLSALRGQPADDGVRLCLLWAGVSVLVSSLVVAKQPHYMLPVIPALALLAARAIDARPASAEWMAGGVALTITAGLAFVLPALLPDYDVRPAAQQLAAIQASGRPVAMLEEYRGEYDFAGRLRAPIVSIHDYELDGWLAQHPDGVVLTHDAGAEALPLFATFMPNLQMRSAVPPAVKPPASP